MIILDFTTRSNVKFEKNIENAMRRVLAVICSEPGNKTIIYVRTNEMLSWTRWNVVGLWQTKAELKQVLECFIGTDIVLHLLYPSCLCSD